MPDAFTLQSIKQRRRISEMNRKRRRRKAPKPPAWLYPRTAETRYRSILLLYVQHIRHVVDAILMPKIPGFIQEANRDLPKSDAWAGDMSDAMNDVNSWLDRNPGVSDPGQVALGVAIESSNFNQQQWRKIVRAVLSVDLFKSEPWLNARLEAFVVENVALIKSIRDQSLQRIEQRVVTAIQQGERWDKVRDMIMNEYGRSENRAKLIARDQVGKLNGDLTKLRQTDIGVTHYIWRTSLDERVRGYPAGPPVPPTQDHWLREGQQFAWVQPPPDGHPGFPIQCRCYAEPVMQPLFEETAPAGDII